MSCPVPGCPQGLPRNRPCPGLREHRYEILNKQVIPAGSLGKARRAPGAEQSWIPQTLRWCLGSPGRAGRALREQGWGSAGAIASLPSSAHHFTFLALTGRPGQHGAGAVTPIHLAPALSCPQQAAAQPSPRVSARLGDSAVLLSRAGWGARLARLSGAARGSGIPPAAPKGARAVPQRAVPRARLPLPAWGSHTARLTYIPRGCGLAAAAEHTPGPCQGRPDAGGCGRSPPAHSLPQAHPAQGWKEASPAPGKEGWGDSQPAAPLPASAGCRNGAGSGVLVGGSGLEAPSGSP